MKKSGLIPIFTPSYVQNILKDFVTKQVDKEEAVLLRIGEEFVNNARQNGEYTDRTGNLRSSIGYILLRDGVIINQNIVGKTTEGRRIAAQLANEFKNMYNTGLVLVGFAGMEYAAAVESKGYDVISGSAPTKEQLLKAFKKFLT
jgi:hypothetical protein